jgi:RNA polymerase sigma factor (sigma-70 family)
MPVDRLTRLGPAPEGSLATDDLRWLQALARRLARDPAEADDLAQEAWLAAGRTSSVPTRSRRAWLFGVLRNRERMLRRSEARRRHREAQADEAGASAAADLELHRRRVLSTLHEAMQELDEDDRALLLSRYCDEHHAPELAERLGLPASTVRSRLSRATARVRQHLDERWGGDRQAWAPAVLAFPSPARVGGPAITGSKRYSMTAVGMKIAIAMVAVSTAVGAWGLATGRFGGSQDQAPASTSTEAGDAEAERDARLAALRAQHEQNPLDRTPAALDGRVLAAATGEPLGGALVMVMPHAPGGPSIAPRVLTDAEGSFRIEGLPAGRYTITAAAFGHLPARHDALELAPGEQRHALQLAVAPGGNALEGTITDIGGGPIEGALVQAFRSQLGMEQQRVAYGAITDAEGHYRMMLPDGRWTMEAGGEDYSAARKDVHLARGPGHADFVLVPGAEIHGRVVERATGRPVAGAIVGFGRRTHRGDSRGKDTSEPRETAIADEQGRFVLRPLEPAEYALHASAPGLATLASPRVHAAVGESIADVVVPVDPAFDASGFVVEKADPTRGIGGVEISTMAPGSDIRSFAVTEPDGYFELHGLLPGTHMVMLEGGGAIGSGLEHHLRIEGADRDDALFELERGTSVRGRVEPPTAGTVRVKGRQSQGGFEVMLAAMKLAKASATIAPDGSFDIGAVPPGEWKLVADGEDGSKGELEITVGDTDLDAVMVGLLPHAHVSGMVLDEAGAPLSGLTVRLEAEPDPTLPPSPFGGKEVLGTAVTAADGGFVVYGVAPGSHGLVVVDGRGQPVALLDATKATVEVADHHVEGLELRAALPKARIEGLVRGPDGEPLADAWVVVAAAGQTGVGLRLGSEYTPTITDAGGRFVFEGLAEREYDLYAHGPDADAQGKLEAVSTGANVTLDLEQLAVLHGVVTYAGVPVPRFELEACELGGRHTVLSADGSFTVERLAAGPCHVVVTTDDGAANATVQLGQGDAARVALEIGVWGSLEGVLVSASDGQPLAGVEVVVRAEGGQRKADEAMVGMLLGRGDNETDARGHFEVEGIGPGDGRLVLQLGNPMMGRGQTLGHHAYVIEAGQHLDVGTIVALAPVEVPKAERGSLGMKVEAQRAGDAAAGDDGEPRLARVTWIEPGGPAQRAGLRVGDRVIGFDGLEEAKLGAPTLVDAFQPARIQAGHEYAVKLERDGAPQGVTIVAGPVRE